MTVRKIAEPNIVAAEHLLRNNDYLGREIRSGNIANGIAKIFANEAKVPVWFVFYYLVRERATTAWLMPKDPDPAKRNSIITQRMAMMRIAYDYMMKGKRRDFVKMINKIGGHDLATLANRYMEQMDKHCKIGDWTTGFDSLEDMVTDFMVWRADKLQPTPPATNGEPLRVVGFSY